MTNISYPDSFYRGISKTDFIDAFGIPNNQAFQFSDEGRSDGFYELSINWNDDEESLAILFNQKKGDGEIQFKAGAYEMSFPLLKQITSRYIQLGHFNYERSEVEGNKYHGNLLIKQDLPTKADNKSLYSLIRDALILVSSQGKLHPRPEDNKDNDITNN